MARPLAPGWGPQPSHLSLPKSIYSNGPPPVIGWAHLRAHYHELRAQYSPCIDLLPQAERERGGGWGGPM